MNKFLKEFKERGFFINALVRKAIRVIRQKKISAYIGFDCTAEVFMWVVYFK